MNCLFIIKNVNYFNYVIFSSTNSTILNYILMHRPNLQFALQAEKLL